jgi:HD-like signal output (HDOD) protein
VTRVLFVDDEPLVLRSLDRALRSRKLPWEARFVDSSTGALELLAREPFDVVVADLRIPDLDGVALLGEVRRSYPWIARLVLSGQVGTDDGLRAMRVAHQCMAKPCNIETLRHIVGRLQLGAHLVDDELAGAATALACLPSPPRVHAEVSAAIARGAGLAELAAIIDGDVAVTAKLIQVVNSVFWSSPASVGPSVTTVQRALTVLGPDVVRDLLLGVEVFRGLESGAGSTARVAALAAHSRRVAEVARGLAPRELAGDAYLAGTLHDLGELVLEGLGQADRADHARAGGYLLNLWGLKDRVVDAITHHHAPEAVADDVALVDLVHVAEVAVSEREGAGWPLSPAWLARNGADRLAEARALADAPEQPS